MMQRRTVLAALGSAMAVSFVPVGVLASTKRSLRELYSDVVGSRFRLIDSNGDRATANLVIVEKGPSCPGLEQFSLVFEGQDVNEGLYDVYHPAFGKSQIALMQSGRPDARRKRCRAYFSTFA